LNCPLLYFQLLHQLPYSLGNIYICHHSSSPIVINYRLKELNECLYSNDSTYFLQSLLEYLAGSIFCSAHPPTPSATPMTLSVSIAASSPPFCFFYMWGNTYILHLNLNLQYLFIPSIELVKRRVWFRRFFYIACIFVNYLNFCSKISWWVNILHPWLWLLGLQMKMSI
jgi:hypothetical protein